MLPRSLTCLALLCAAPAAMAQTAACPTQDFESFLARFGVDVAFQKQVTPPSIMFEYFDFDSGDEPVSKVETLPRDKMLWPVVDLGVLAQEDLAAKHEDMADGGKKLIVHGIEDGRNTTYFFAAAPCWTLVRIADWSM